MRLSFRWYGDDDPIPLSYIKQIPNMQGIVSAVYDVPTGDVWPRETIASLKKNVEQAGLSLEVIESVPVHEDIKLGLPSRDQYIKNFQETIKNLSQEGIHTVCYNFMPIFDWVRSTLYKPMSDGSTTLAYSHQEIAASDPVESKFDLPGWGALYDKNQMKGLLQQYHDMTEEDLWQHLTYFLQEVVPVAEAYDVKLAIHPDDPPWSVFGLPRIITNRENLQRVVDIVDSPSNGLTVCTGSLGSYAGNDVIDIVRDFATQQKIHFMHFRNVKRYDDDSFDEVAHFSDEGSVDMAGVMKAAVQTGFSGPIRPDHGRMIWGEEGNPGYGLYDRALGATYINGLWEAIQRFAIDE